MTRTVEATIALAYVPKSLNRTVGGSPWTWRQAKASLQRDFEALLMAERIPRPVEHIAASAQLTFTTTRRRDEGNYRTLIEKALGDALTNGGWLADDTPEYYQFGGLTFTRAPRPATMIAVVWTEP